MNLQELGWNNRLQQAFSSLQQSNLIPARIFSENRGSYLLMSEQGELTATISGRYRNSAQTRTDLPAVGDWVAIEPQSEQVSASIHTLLPRYSTFIRKAAGFKTQEQVVAANIDYVFIVCGLDDNFNIRRIERYIALTWSSGAQPVVILNKADVISNPDQLAEMRDQVEKIALGVPIHIISALNADTISELHPYFTTGVTVALLGSSGVGKSTLINLLLNTEQQKTIATRTGDSKGRHTTTQRQLFMLPNSGMVIDTPGMRELQLWMDEETLAASFSDIKELAQHCKFRDCQHDTEPGCAVQAAITTGKLELSRLIGYSKMRRELQHLATRQQENQWQSRKADRKFGKMCRDIMKHKKNK